MKLVKLANNDHGIKLSVKDWYDIGVLAGWLPNIPKKLFYEYLTEHGYRPSTGGYHASKWVCPGKRPVPFTSHSGKDVHPPDLFKSLDIMGSSLQEFKKWVSDKKSKSKRNDRANED